MRTPPPDKLDGASVVLWAHISAMDTTESANVAVCRYEGENSFYLFWCDADWNVHSDTLHDSVDDATDAIFQFNSDVGRGFGASMLPAMPFSENRV